MDSWRWVDSRIRLVRLEGVKTYLLSRGWVLTPNPNPRLLRFGRPGDEVNPSVTQIVPASDAADDFMQSITYFITTLSKIEDRHPVEVLDDILRYQADEERTNQ